MASNHTRSFSFPSKSHPVTNQLDEQLRKLKSSEAASTSTSFTNKLTNLSNLHKSVDEYLQLPQNQKIVTSHSLSGVDEVLDGSLRLLDICSTSKDVLAQSKECLQDIESVLRRRCSSGELNMTSEIAEYLKSRKITKKVIKKCLKDIKDVVRTNELDATDSIVKDVQAMTIDVFKSLLSYIGGSQKRMSWSFAKLVRQTAEKELRTPINKFDDVDATLELMNQKKKANVDMSQIVELESEVQDIDNVLECLFRSLVKTRATLLNVLSN